MTDPAASVWPTASAREAGSAAQVLRISRGFSCLFWSLPLLSAAHAAALGLFDYLADLFGFDDSAMGRFKTALLTFIPPMIGGLVKPDGFLYAIGYAGLAATIWAAIVPALLARASRKRFGSPQFRVWGGTPMIVLILLFGLGNAVVHILSSVNLLPVYQ